MLIPPTLTDDSVGREVEKRRPEFAILIWIGPSAAWTINLDSERLLPR